MQTIHYLSLLLCNTPTLGIPVVLGTLYILVYFFSETRRVRLPCLLVQALVSEVLTK